MSIPLCLRHNLTFPQFLRDYFYANGEGPVPLEALQNQKYRDVVSIRLYYDWHTCVSLLSAFLQANRVLAMLSWKNVCA